MEILDLFTGNIAIGLATAFTPMNLLYCFVGVFLGMLVGVMPGIGAMSAISMLFPLTFYLEPTTALIMLAGIWYGTAYGDSLAAILLNVPGATSTAITCLDGYPMARQGRAGVALLMTTVASFIGGSIGILLMMAFSPIIVAYAQQFGSAEYFALMLLGLISASNISNASPAKSMSMGAFGIALGTVGMDLYTGTNRFTFGSLELTDGIGIVGLAMGLFGVSEIISSVREVSSSGIDPKAITFRSMIPSRDDIRRSWRPILRGAGIGSFFGTLPGTGSAIATFVAYGTEKRIAREPQRFGKGAIEGIVAPEAANNAADQTAFIPTMTLGIPGSATMAIMLGALLIQGITPGPTLMTKHPDVFWGLVMSFWIGNLMLLLLNIPLIGLWIRILTIPYHLLYPAILMFICIGVYSVNNSAFDVWTVVAFGALGYLMRIGGFPAAPMILGFVLGPLMEEHFRRAMMLSRGDVFVFVERPVSSAVLAICVALLAWGVFRSMRRRSIAGLPNELSQGEDA